MHRQCTSMVQDQPSPSTYSSTPTPVHSLLLPCTSHLEGAPGECDRPVAVLCPPAWSPCRSSAAFRLAGQRANAARDDHDVARGEVVGVGCAGRVVDDLQAAARFDEVQRLSCRPFPSAPARGGCVPIATVIAASAIVAAANELVVTFGRIARLLGVVVQPTVRVAMHPHIAPWSVPHRSAEGAFPGVLPPSGGRRSGTVGCHTPGRAGSVARIVAPTRHVRRFEPHGDLALGVALAGPGCANCRSRHSTRISRGRGF